MGIYLFLIDLFGLYNFKFILLFFIFNIKI